MRSFPIDALRGPFEQLEGPVVITSPTGSGKSTKVPTWCEPPVLCVQPRRVAARSLAAWLGGNELGESVGYAVRGESRMNAHTPIVYATTGVALRMLASPDWRYRTVVLDEFHERSLDLDLLLALVPGRARLVVLSATIEGDRVAAHLGGTHLRGEGRTFPVDIQYAQADRTLPTPDRLGERVRQALLRHADAPGDRLVFVPGKAEIQRVCRAVADLGEVHGLHGDLSLAEQSRVFRTDGPQRIVVSTNVAETSITLPRTRLVIDSGLVRRTRYKSDRGYLTLVPIAQDSADQRAGRAGRTAPGLAVRLWGERAPLTTVTPPELHRESLVPFVLAAAAAGHADLRLPFLDTPPEHAVETAREHLKALDALDTSGELTARGRRLFGLPLDAAHGRLLIEAEERGTLGRIIDLVAVLSVGRDLFRPGPREDDLREQGCDVLGILAAMDRGKPSEHGLDAWVLDEARKTARRLNVALGKPTRTPIDRRALADTVLAGLPQCAHVARVRKRRVAWSNGGTEIELSKRSAIDHEKHPVIAVLSSVALGHGKDTSLLGTVAMALEPHWLVEAGIGRAKLAEVQLEKGVAVGVVEHQHAGRTLDRRSEPLRGALAREAIATLFLRGTLFKGGHKIARERLALANLARALDGLPLVAPDLDTFVSQRIVELGVEEGGDIAFLSPEDLCPPALEPHRQAELRRQFPAQLKLGTARFRVEPEPSAKRVTLHNLGARLKQLPRASWLPRFLGWSVRVEDRNTYKWIRR